MKTLPRLPWICLSIAFLSVGIFSAYAYFTADGRGLFHVVVRVTDRELNSMEGATVELKNAGSERMATADRAPNPNLKNLLKLFQPATTNAAGDALVYYYGGFTDSSTEGYHQSVAGTLCISKPGYEDYSVELSKLLTNSLSLESNRTPQVQVVLLKKK